MLTALVIWLNAIANQLGRVLLAPVAWLPGWLSATLIGIVTGVVMLVIFKHTSRQSAIKQARDQIKANTLALSLFKDDLRVSLACQARLLGGAGKLLLHSLVPMAVMTLPMILVLGQMALWYQNRPLRVDEAAIVTVRMQEYQSPALERLHLEPDSKIRVVNGPVRVPSKNMACWEVALTEQGQHSLQFTFDGQQFSKQIVSGESFQQTSLKRPSREITELFLHPRETPFALESPVQEIEVIYPRRDSWTAGTNYWVFYWFLVSMIAAFAAKPFFNVNI